VPESDGGAVPADAEDAGVVTVGPTPGGPGGDGPSGDGGTDGDQQALIDAGESPECPDCGSMALHYSEGCKTCESCGWSEC
jgi:ribonucleoside-diphosphate reductase alpha chain